MSKNAGISLNSLASNLPTQSKGEQQLMNDFRAAAQSITTLYRQAKDNNKKAYDTGYMSACKDVLDFIRAGRTGDRNVDSDATLAWLEARMAEIESREEDTDEEDSNARTQRPSVPPSAASSPVVPPPPRPQSPVNLALYPAVATMNHHEPEARAESPEPPTPRSEVRMMSSTVPPPTTIGAKRRHAAMMAESSSSSIASPVIRPTASFRTPRRRRSHANMSRSVHEMDVVEEDGPERKRVARR